MPAALVNMRRMSRSEDLEQSLGKATRITHQNRFRNSMSNLERGLQTMDSMIINIITIIDLLQEIHSCCHG